MPELSDEDLLERFRAGRESGTGAQWLDQLLSRYHSRVATWCYRFTGDRESAADLAQDIFLKVYRNLESFRGEAKFSTWLYTVARNHCFNEMKTRASRVEQTTDVLELELRDDRQSDALAAIQRQESLEAMRTIIDQNLDETEKKVMTLHFAHEISLDGVTRMLDLQNASGARAYVVSAKRKLTAAMQRWSTRQGGH